MKSTEKMKAPGKGTPRRMKADIEKLRALMERLRAPGGCPWDRGQTVESLVPFIIEEAYEVVSAIDGESDDAVMEELGDLLFQIIFICRLKEEEGRFGVKDVIDACVEKMTRRHPHVFGENPDKDVLTPGDVVTRWAEIKKDEKKGGKKEGCLSGVAEALPALLRAHKISQKAAKTGFDWKDACHALEKVDEEIREFKEAVQSKGAKAMEEELGDILFTIVNVARFFEVNPENALRKTIGKFIERFHYIERTLEENGKAFPGVTLGEMEALWKEAKKERTRRMRKGHR